MTDTPNIDDTLFPNLDGAALLTPPHKTMPQILIPYGSLRPRSFSRLSCEEAGLVLTRLGAEVRFFNPAGLPVVDDDVDAKHPKLRKLRDLVACCEGMPWSSPERHGAMTGLMKAVFNNEGIRTGRNVAITPQGRRLAPCPLTPLSKKLSAAHSSYWRQVS